MAAFTEDETIRFLLEPTPCISSNVAMAEYDELTAVLTIWFHTYEGTASRSGMVAYEYAGITPERAYSFAQAPSKGTWVWEELRETGQPYRKQGQVEWEERLPDSTPFEDTILNDGAGSGWFHGFWEEHDASTRRGKGKRSASFPDSLF